MVTGFDSKSMVLSGTSVLPKNVVWLFTISLSLSPKQTILSNDGMGAGCGSRFCYDEFRGMVKTVCFANPT